MVKNEVSTKPTPRIKNPESRIPTGRRPIECWQRAASRDLQSNCKHQDHQTNSPHSQEQNKPKLQKMTVVCVGIDTKKSPRTTPLQHQTCKSNRCSRDHGTWGKKGETGFKIAPRALKDRDRIKKNFICKKQEKRVEVLATSSADTQAVDIRDH